MKNYNPFKMAGSYVGALIGIIIEIVSISKWTKYPFIINNQRVYLTFFQSLHYYWIELIWIISFGFLLGWAIHSLIRRFRK